MQTVGRNAQLKISMNKLIYTLYLYSRARKLEDHFLISGGMIYFFFHLDVLATIKLVCLMSRVSFIDYVSENKVYFFTIILGFSFLAQLYARELIRRQKLGRLSIKRVELSTVFQFMIYSMLFFLWIMIFF